MVAPGPSLSGTGESTTLHPSRSSLPPTESGAPSTSSAQRRPCVGTPEKSSHSLQIITRTSRTIRTESELGPGSGHPLEGIPPPPLNIFLFHRKFADYFAAGLPTSSPRAKSAAPKLMSRVSPVASLAGRVSMPLKLLPHAMSAAVRLSVFILRCARHALFLPPRGLNHVIR